MILVKWHMGFGYMPGDTDTSRAVWNAACLNLSLSVGVELPAKLEGPVAN